MKTIKNIFSFVIAGSAMVVIASCGKGNPDSPGVEFMPDMYRSPSLETNMMQHYNGDSMMVNRHPAAGSVARGYMPDVYTPADTNGYENAGRFLKNPIPVNDAVLAEGEKLYAAYCTHCHGTTGAGDGKVGMKLPGQPPAYSTPTIMALPEGKMYYSITYGKGLMGPHGPLMTQEERWKVVHYITATLQKRGGNPSAPVDSAAAKKAGAK
jgi:mono/diheme cytochrome c family protein